MTSKTLDDAKRECLTDPLCNMFYKVCGDESDVRFRKCNKTAYEEESGCGEILKPSTLYKKGNVIVIWPRLYSINCCNIFMKLSLINHVFQMT